jgi:cyclic pyranopterin phosphate synthase
MRGGSMEQCISWFTVVEIEVNSRCNRRCSYCPVSVLPPTKGDRFMSQQLFERIISELVKIKFCGKISYHFYNEPLLRCDLEALVSKVAGRLPDIFQLLFTNGDLLSDERYTSLRQAGIDHFFVTRHDYAPMVSRPNQTVQVPSDLILTNRGGILDSLAEPSQRPCFAPSEMLIITVNGDVLLCCDDAERTQVMGNIARQQIEEIWMSTEFVRVRKLLQAGNRGEASSICRLCNNQEYFAVGAGNKNYLRKTEIQTAD